MQNLTGPDFYSLSAAQGWAELGNYHEANAELEADTGALRSHPDALEVRWQIYAHSKNWEACADLGETMVKKAPQRVRSWIHRSYALHELERTQEAFDKLLPAAKIYSKEWSVPYNLARYTAQLLRVDEAWKWFKKAVAIDEKAAKAEALDDLDLQPLWDSIGGMLRKCE